MNKKNHFAEKRLTAFTNIGTSPKEWRASPIRTMVSVEKKNKAGDIFVHWVPEYEIPEGYTNPYPDDVENSDRGKHCQLCGTHLEYHGIICHDEKKLYMVVGHTCYIVYETDDNKMLTLQLLSQMKKDFDQKRLDAMREDVTARLTEYLNRKQRLDLSHKFYMKITRNIWMGWRKQKCTNLLTTYAAETAIIGYQPDRYLFRASYRQYLTNIMKMTLNYSARREKYPNEDYKKSFAKVDEFYSKVRKESTEQIEWRAKIALEDYEKKQLMMRYRV